MATPPKVTVVRPRHVVWGALWMGLLVAGGVLQTHLRFAERDMEIQTRQAQEDMSSLADDKASLEATVAALRSDQQVRERATNELGLVPATPLDVHRLAIDKELWAKYAGDGTNTDLAWESHSPEPAWVEWIDRTMNVAEGSAEKGPNR